MLTAVRSSRACFVRKNVIPWQFPKLLISCRAGRNHWLGCGGRAPWEGLSGLQQELRAQHKSWHSSKNGSHPPCLLGPACNKDVVSCLLCMSKPIWHLFKSSSCWELEDLPLNEQCSLAAPWWVAQVGPAADGIACTAWSGTQKEAWLSPWTRWCLAEGNTLSWHLSWCYWSAERKLWWILWPFCHQKH